MLPIAGEELTEKIQCNLCELVDERDNLLAEVERLKTENKELNNTIKIIHEKNNKLTDQMLEMYTYDAVKNHGLRIARSCAEIAETLPNWLDPESTTTDFDAIAEEIRKEFNIESEWR